jgi:CHAD domain-containing protein
MTRRALPADLPARSAEEAVRRLALAELDRATAARERLVAGDRDEALHDLRVALRRLRSLLRAHRAEFSLDYPKKLVRRVSALAAATNPGRDAEVQLGWLGGIEEALRPAERAGHRELSRQLEERRDESYRKVEREVVRDFAALADDLAESLSSYRVAVRLDGGKPRPLFAAASRVAILEARDELRRRLTAIASPADEEAGHEARIAAKRLRYLMEPLGRWSAETRAPVARLKSLQDLLGELHDGQLLAAHVAASLAEIESRQALGLVEAAVESGDPAAAERSGRGDAARVRRRLRPGLMAVARALGEHRNELFTRIAAGWLGEPAPELAALEGEIDALAERLAAPARSWRGAAAASGRKVSRRGRSA